MNTIGKAQRNLNHLIQVSLLVQNDDLVTVKDIIKLVNRFVVKQPKYEKGIRSIQKLNQEGSNIFSLRNKGESNSRDF